MARRALLLLLCGAWVGCSGPAESPPRTPGEGPAVPSPAADGSELAAAEADPETGRLIVFLQDSPVDLAFRRTTLPRLEGLAQGQEVILEVRDPREGAPPEVAITPLLVYQNFRGRSIYQGRSHQVERIRNFLRTSRYSPQGESGLAKSDLPVWQWGRARVGAPLKITELGGRQPPGHGAAAFEAEVRAALAAGFERFRFRDRVELGRADRLFYLDIYPYRGEGDRLFVSWAVYSQFNCVRPVFSSSDDPLAGPWDERSRLFAELARRFESVVADRLADGDGGDGFEAVPREVATVSWVSLGLALPAAPERSVNAAAPIGELPRSWRVDQDLLELVPGVQFHFQAPLDYYAGEVRDVSGWFRVPEDYGLAGARGRVEVKTGSVTMGEPELDEEIRGKKTLDASQHPISYFEIDRVAAGEQSLRFGEESTIQLQGRFEMRGVVVELPVRLQVLPVVGSDGGPRLIVQGGFQLRLREVWGILGPDGPAPANDTLVFEISLEMIPATP